MGYLVEERDDIPVSHRPQHLHFPVSSLRRLPLLAEHSLQRQLLTGARVTHQVNGAKTCHHV